MIRVVGAKSAEILANRALNRVKVMQNKIPATNLNTADALARKYRALEGAQTSSVRTKTLNDGRV